MGLYVLGASGAGRSQVQHFNEFDPCCFAGTGFRTYVPSVTRVVRKVGGGFNAVLDGGSREHSTSPRTARRILAHLGRS